MLKTLFSFNLSPIYSSVSLTGLIPTAKTDLHFDVVDVFRGAQCDLGVVRIISAVADVNADIELLLVGLNDKAGKSQHTKKQVLVNTKLLIYLASNGHCIQYGPQFGYVDDLK